nr:Chain C, MERS-CoV peptide 37-3 [Middle East respiratory syndrome-related coronavirus]
KYYSIIPHSI